MWKKALCIVTAITMITMITACNSGTEDQVEEVEETQVVKQTRTNAQGQVVSGSGESTDSGEESETIVTDAEGNVVSVIGGGNTETTSYNPAVEGKKVVNFWIINQGKDIQSVLNDATKNFNNTNSNNILGQISYKAAGGDSGYTGFDDQLVPAIAAGNGPDIILTGRTHYSDFVVLDDYINKYSDSDFSTGMVYPSNLENVKVDGQYYGLPFSSTYAVFLLYNKTMFKAAGLDPNQPPKTLAQLDDYAEKMTTAGADNLYATVGFCPWEWYINLVGPYRLFNGGMSADNGTPTPNTPENVRALEWVQNYVNKYGYQKMEDSMTAIAPGGNPFESGKLGMQMVYTGHIADAAQWTFDWGIADMPGESGAVDGTSTTDLMAIFKTSSYPEEAFLYAKALCVADTQTKLMAYANEMPTFSPIEAANEANYDVFNPTMRTILQQVYPNLAGKAYTAPTAKRPDNYSTLVNEMFNNVLTGGNPASLLADLQSKVDAAIALM